MRYLSIFILSLLCSLSCLPLQGQNAPQEAAAKSVTTANPQVDQDELELLLKPLTKSELEKEVNAWLELTKEQAQMVSQFMIKQRNAEAPDPAVAESLSAARESQTRLTDRLRTTVEAFRTKGGDTEDLDKYISAVSGVSLNGGSITASTGILTKWLTSKEGGIRWGLNLLKFILVLIVAQIISKAVAGVVGKVASQSKLKISELLQHFIVNATKKIVFIIGFLIALSMLEINIGPVLAGLGVAGFIIGFALQDTLSNFAAGFMILLYQPYDVGDVVTVGGTSGGVVSMNMVSTTIKTFDNQKVIIPNGKIWGDIIINSTGNKTRRVDLIFGIGYEDDIAKAQSILEDIVEKHELILSTPEPVIKVHELADSSVNFICRPWTKTADYWNVYWDLMRTVKERFDADGVSIPYPQTDVHLHQS